ncbi:hypothetical protein Q2T76_06090 [Lactobacillus sp. YT155]|uniref:PTS sugar transporter subunit IIA n=1 Tax=Lactobacillus sp. YT155 TaxID=3060955 RepID=UPI00265F40B8|nr:hypothetical protein [Lactobacillus sp. YT155]MDO1605630.1 hypothetical protein [Lactobacillus sp. YT155]
MTQVVIATHGYLADGLKKSFEFIMGEKNNLTAISAYTPDCPNFTYVYQEFIDDHVNEEIIFITDIYGGSVNNELMQAMTDNNKIHLICGANLPLLLQLFINLDSLDIENTITDAIKAGQEGVKHCQRIDVPNETSANDFDSF